MIVYVQARNVYKELEIALEFALNEDQMRAYCKLKKEFDDSVEKHEKAMKEYSKWVNEYKEGKRDKMPENYPGNGPTFEADFEPKYEEMKHYWGRRWHPIGLMGKMTTNLGELIEEAMKVLGAKVNVPQLVAGKYRAYRDRDGKEIGPTDVIGNEESIVFQFVR